MFISVKESRIENNRSFYGCFYLGSFDSGQSLTIANALRRTLLTECAGLSIISIKIDNVMHEYSTLPGVRDSVLDILLNFKEIIIKKKKNALEGPQGYRSQGLSSVYENVGSTVFKPVIGYLKMKGPGVIRAKDLNLPPFVQCVDPTQYIATLADDGYLSLKFVIMEGKNYYIHKNPSLENSTNEQTSNQKYAKNPVQKPKTPIQTNNVFSPKFEVFNDDNDSHFWTITKKRERLLKQLKNILETSKKRKEKVSLNNKHQEIEDKPFPSLEKDFYTSSAAETEKFSFQKAGPQENVNEFWEGVNQNNMTPNIKRNSDAFYGAGTSKQLNIDAVFNPVTKVNYIIEGYENYVVEFYNDRLKAVENLTSFLDSSIFLKTNLPFLKKSMQNNGYNGDKTLESSSKKSSFSQEKSTILSFDKDKSNAYELNIPAKQTRLDKKQKKIKYLNSEIINYLDTNSGLDPKEFLSICSSEGFSHFKGIGISSNFSNTDFPEILSKDFENLEPCLNISQKQIIILEVWTNGSLHPRDALFMAFKSLSSTFNIYNIKMSDAIFTDSTSYKKIIENF